MITGKKFFVEFNRIKCGIPRKVFGLFSVTNVSMPEESKMVISAFAESIAWQIGSVRSTRLSKRIAILKKVLFESGVFGGIRDFVKPTEVS